MSSPAARRLMNSANALAAAEPSPFVIATARAKASWHFNADFVASGIVDVSSCLRGILSHPWLHTTTRTSHFRADN
jgi:hypothetical protein